MKRPTFKELIDFILAQPNDKPLNMNQNYVYESCGCILVHFGKHKGYEFAGCGWSEFSSENGEEIAFVKRDIPKVRTFIKEGTMFDRCFQTYGDAKDRLKELNYI